MLRATLQDALRQRSLVRLRYTSTSTSTSTSTKDVPPILPQRKSKVDLHPAPKKIDSTNYLPSKPVVKAASSSKASPPQPTPSPRPSNERLGIKETIQRDIKNAEELGVLKPAPPDANTFRKIIHSTWEITKFYFRGAKLIYLRQKEIGAIKRRIRNGGLGLTRAEGRLIEVQRKDISKVIPFVVVAVILEELIPVIALYAPFMLPSTCVLPAQRERIEEKKAIKALASYHESRALILSMKSKVQDGKLPLTALSGTGVASVVCSLLRLPTFGIDSLRMWRIWRHLHFIARDDYLLLKDDLLNTMSKHDLDQALSERGFITQGLSIKDSQARLKWWLNSVKDYPTEEAVERRLPLLMERR
ncbi:hypothetical protein Moror_9022 [Moniliophthora roreri MCA 2997]|uniref:Letm1 RBD domain-containing protein n=2 Tax=Moniliophthora roreri TaxID=221103 RepID=V2YMN1_MONRO|nr:hypothetical protein Moror_9022 [Moniliophthora roreri MCA 2997]KAI3615155.1 hypothetical protein WG66_003652 [Moniliophthora roreri]